MRLRPRPSAPWTDLAGRLIEAPRSEHPRAAPGELFPQFLILRLQLMDPAAQRVIGLRLGGTCEMPDGVEEPCHDVAPVLGVDHTQKIRLGQRPHNRVISVIILSCSEIIGWTAWKR